MPYIESVPMKDNAWLYERVDGSNDADDTQFVRCPHCGAVYGFVATALLPSVCGSCGADMTGGKTAME